ncbi:MAG: TonB-dependent receptor [Steroidobacteraceae bacterium]|nr:TonB-dependent receptor [Steroidobacteraceae bacterium]MDW8259905.1 TonB-dependent receptor [Gammaproteobacteria bacterium]
MRKVFPLIVLVLAPYAARGESAETAPAAELEEVVVYGRGEARQSQGISAAQIDYLPAGTSPLKAIEKLPGVNFQSADPYGAYEWSTRIVVRGFNQNQLGFTLDGIPLGDMSYGNHNGLHISRAVPSENVARVVLSQGSGSLGTASTSNLGGTIAFASIDPSTDFAGRVDVTGGSDSMRRLYGRLDTGELGGAATRLSLTVVDQDSEKWKGAGDQRQRVYNLKVVQPVGAATVIGYFNYSDRAEIDYQDLSFDILARRGRDWDNYFPNWTAAVAAAQSCAAQAFNAPICDDAYWNASGLRKDKLGYLAVEVPFGADATRWRLTGYAHRNDGQGLWGTPYVPTPGGAPLSVRTTEYDIDRKGVLTSLSGKAQMFDWQLGLWIENNDFQQARRFYPEPRLAGPTQNFTEFLRNPFLTQWQYRFDTKTRQWFAQLDWPIAAAVRISAGLKSLNVENSAATIVGPNKTGTIEARKRFLPQIGFTWTRSDNHEFFGQAVRNARAFVSANTAGPFSTTAAGFAAIRDVLEPETATTVELGWRFRNATLEGVLTAFRVKFNDRLLAIQQGPGIVGNPAVLANVGSVSTDGVELAFGWRPLRHVSWFNSLAWTDSRYDDNYLNNGVLIRTAGKRVVDTPELLLKSELTYDNGRFFARLDGSFVDERYYTYLNQGSVDSYSVFNAGLGYRLPLRELVDELTLQGSVTNLTDKFYIATIGSNGFINADPTGTAQTLLPGAPRQFFVSVKARF